VLLARHVVGVKRPITLIATTVTTSLEKLFCDGFKGYFAVFYYDFEVDLFAGVFLF
jgi:hypothetical protein